MKSYRLPFPVSVNEMFINNKGRGKGRIISPDYRKWKGAAGLMLACQIAKGQRAVQKQVFIEILLNDRRKGDCDNRIKAVLDILVDTGILKGDSKKYVKGVSAEWEDFSGQDTECLVNIYIPEARCA